VVGVMTSGRAIVNPLTGVRDRSEMAPGYDGDRRMTAPAA